MSAFTTLFASRQWKKAKARYQQPQKDLCAGFLRNICKIADSIYIIYADIVTLIHQFGFKDEFEEKLLTQMFKRIYVDTWTAKVHNC